MERGTVVDFLHIERAFSAFAAAEATQGQEHIRPLHRHVALRLVLEGGFFPDEITPHPPLRAERTSAGWSLLLDEQAETKSELTVFGGMKTKQIDVVVSKPGIGPVVAVSVKGTLRAYRNLVNRMEEAIGDSTNVHAMYPGLVYGFLHIMRTNREADGYGPRDMGVTRNDTVSPLIERYCSALYEMTGRRFVRNDCARYEAVGLGLVENDPERLGSLFDRFPPPDSPLRLESFFGRLFQVYDLRFPSRAEHLSLARREQWEPDSPFLREVAQEHQAPLPVVLGYFPRLA